MYDQAIDKYKTTKRIGQGTFGQVYLAEDTSNNNQQVAIKQLKWSKQTLIVKIPNFTRQVQIMKSLRHRNIVKFIEQFEYKGKVYIVSEYCSNGELGKYIQKNTLSLNEKVNVCRDIIHGLEFIHSEGYIHRDIKPENIFIDHDMTFKIGDYGLGKKYEEGVRNTRLVGTPLYTPPNILQGNDEYTQKCDVFSVGLVIYLLLFGKHLFEDARNYIGIMSLQKKLEHNNLERFIKDLQCDTRFQLILRGTLAYEEENRLTSKELRELFNKVFPIGEDVQKIFEENLQKVQMYFLEIEEKMREVDKFLEVARRLQRREYPIDQAKIHILTFLTLGVYAGKLDKICFDCQQEYLSVMEIPVYWAIIQSARPIRDSFVEVCTAELEKGKTSLFKAIEKAKSQARKINYQIPDNIYQLFMEVEEGFSQNNWVKFKKEFSNYYRKEINVDENYFSAEYSQTLKCIRQIMQ